IERNAYIILLVSYCLYHFCLGTLLLILRAHSDYLKDANIARVGGISARKYPRHWIQWFTMIISFLYPVILLILIVQPLFGILLFIFIILGYRFWKGMVIPERTTLWHEDLVRLGVYGAPGSATGAPGYAKGYEVREMQERKRWYQRGMLDRRNYSMKEEATGFGVLDEVHRVIYERTTYRLPDHIAKIMVPVLVILACISFVVFIGVLLCTMYMLGLGKAMAVGRSRGGTFETTYLFPISGREIVFSRYPDKKR
ncbi:MAG: hypothetical protein KAU14_07080, partial [Thermoplasmata archaeon]|nr:hypothetical protein [Thermoplasmata archaeon]